MTEAERLEAERLEELRGLVESCELDYTHECKCDHKLQGTGAVFFQSLDFLYCAEPGCRGFQKIRKPVDKKTPLD